MVHCQGSYDDTIVTINSTLFGLQKPKVFRLRIFVAVLTAANSLGAVMGSSVSFNLEARELADYEFLCRTL